MMHSGTIGRATDKHRTWGAITSASVFAQPSRKWVLAGLLLLAVLAFLIWQAGHQPAKTAVNSTSQSSQTPEVNANGQISPSQNQQVTPVNPAPSASATSQGASNSDTNHAEVNIDGQSVSADSNSSKPNASVNKTINTAGGSSNVSIQSNVNGGAGGHRSSFQNVNVNSHSSGNSNVDINVDQNSSGVSMP